MVSDYPLGAGGHGFKKVHGDRYLRDDGLEISKSVHNGFINEACEWGIQGFTLRMLFVGGALLLLWQTVRAPDLDDDTFARLLGCCLFAGLIGFCVTCLFGDFIDAEWGYWMVAFAVIHARLYGARSPRPAAVASHAHQVRPPVHRQRVMANSGA